MTIKEEFAELMAALANVVNRPETEQVKAALLLDLFIKKLALKPAVPGDILDCLAPEMRCVALATFLSVFEEEMEKKVGG